MKLINRSHNFEKEVYERFKSECDKRSINTSKLIRDLVNKKLEEWQDGTI